MKVHNKSDGRVSIRSNKKGPEDQSDTDLIDEQSHGSASVDHVRLVVTFLQLSILIINLKTYIRATRVACICINSSRDGEAGAAGGGTAGSGIQYQSSLASGGRFSRRRGKKGSGFVLVKYTAHRWLSWLSTGLPCGRS